MFVILSEGWDYVSEMRPPSGLLLMAQMMYEHGDARWNSIDRRKLIRPPELSGYPTGRVIY
jgi:hypothetical protein